MAENIRATIRILLYVEYIDWLISGSIPSTLLSISSFTFFISVLFLFGNKTDKNILKKITISSEMKLFDEMVKK